VGIDTYLVIPTPSPARAKLELEGGGDSVSHVGRDYLVLHKSDRYREVNASPETWGPRYAEELPSSIRKGLDRRGLLACPEVGQTFAAKTYSDEVRNHASPLWLPVRRPHRKLVKRLLLVALSPARERMVLEEPELVRELIEGRRTTPIPGSIEFDDCWIELQKVLFDCLWLSGIDDARCEALTPRAGLSLFEDRTIDSARLVRAERARVIAEWVLELPLDALARARRNGPSPASRSFPESLGSAEADDDEPLRTGSSRVAKKPPHSDQKLEAELQRLRGFYADLLSKGQAVLSIRFREEAAPKVPRTVPGD
jgi:hypothetical protein